MAAFKRGAKVDADFGDQTDYDGFQIAFVLDGPDGPEEKYTLQSPQNGKPVGGFAYQETKSGEVTGLTFKSL